MARSIIATLAILVLGSIGLAVLAQEKSSPAVEPHAPAPTLALPTNVETITFTPAMKMHEGAQIQVTAGDVVFFVPSFSVPAGKAGVQNVTVEDGTLVMRTEATFQIKSVTMKLHAAKPTPDPNTSWAPETTVPTVPSADGLKLPPFDPKPVEVPPTF